jgi:NADPH-dependent glutamate synthase beta subunit-like oxidoreductase
MRRRHTSDCTAAKLIKYKCLSSAGPINHTPTALKNNNLGLHHRHHLQIISINSMAGRELDILIVGAGIAGLAASIALREKGHRVTVLEAAPQVRSPLW